MQGEYWMRLFIINVLATAMLLTVATQASAVTITQGGLLGTYAVSDTIVLTYTINTQGFAGLQTVGFNVQYDPTELLMTGDFSKGNILKDKSGNKLPSIIGWLTPATDPDQLNNAWGGGVGTTWAEKAAEEIATLQFHVLPGATGGSINLVIGPGTALDQRTGTYAVPGVTAAIPGAFVFEGSGSYVVPEPTTALLIGLGLVGLGVAGNRGRQER
jgi:hypothetical protein